MQKNTESWTFRHIQKQEQCYNDVLISEQEWDSWKYILTSTEIDVEDAEFWAFRHIQKHEQSHINTWKSEQV